VILKKEPDGTRIETLKTLEIDRRRTEEEQVDGLIPYKVVREEVGRRFRVALPDEPRSEFAVIALQPEDFSELHLEPIE
jgi:hypothetical protein